MFTRDVYRDQQAPAFALLAVTIRKYGLSILEEEAEFLRMEINRDYDVRLSDLQNDKLQAAINILLTDHFEYDWRVFETCCHLLSNQPTEFDVLNPLEAEQIAIGVAEARLIKSEILDEDEALIFGDEVRAYVGHIFYEYGLHKAPKIFPTAIMPNSVPVNDVTKNEALTELYQTHLEIILDYMDKLS
jgi:hypothetical protein